MTGNIGGLQGIDMTSGLAEDNPAEHQYRGFVTIRATGVEGNVLLGQLSPDEVRKMALQFLETAEAADQDRIVMTMLTRDVGLAPETAASFITKMRDERGEIWRD